MSSSPVKSSSGRSGRPRRGQTAVAVAAVAVTLVGATAVAANASNKSIKVGHTATHLRDCYHPSKQSYPSTLCSDKGQIAADTPVTLVCQYQGENKSGDVWWDYVRTPNNGYGYMSDYYLNTGTSSYRVPGVDLCQY